MERVSGQSTGDKLMRARMVIGNGNVISSRINGMRVDES
jgi:hypothetical protein